MDSILTALEANVDKLYGEKKFKEVEEMFATFVKESQNEPENIRARALNNRGNAKYMQVIPHFCFFGRNRRSEIAGPILCF
jgi:hypothetical protein